MAGRGTEAWRIAEYGQPCESARTLIDFAGLSISVNAAAAPAFERLGELFVAEYGRQPDASQTGAYNCRKIGGSTRWSAHAWALAIDVDWRDNPMRKPLTTTMPQSLRAIGERMTTAGTGAQVFRWGGVWSTPDPMHFEIMATPSEIGEGLVVDGIASSEKGYEIMRRGDQGNAVKWWQQRLEAWRPGVLGADGADGVYGEATEQAVMALEEANGLRQTGTLDLLRATVLVRVAAPTDFEMIELTAIDESALMEPVQPAPDWPAD